MTDYAIWRPERDGHAPPNWRAGMACKAYNGKPLAYAPVWYEGVVYHVHPEALTAPNDDAAFDVAIWLEQGRANLDKLPEGVVLPEPKDWATELWADLRDEHETACQNGRLGDDAAIALIRERVVLKEGV